MSTPQSALSHYRTQVARRPRLTPELERELAAAYQAGDCRAGSRLIEGCLDTVIVVALEYRRWGAPLEDLVQEGNVGLLKAVEHFDPDRGARLSTYAGYWIRSEIREYVARHYRIVRLGSSRSERRALRLYRKTREQRPEVLAAMSGLTPERVTELLPLLVSGDVSLSQEPREGSLPVQDWLASSAATAEEALGDQEERRRLRVVVEEALAAFPAREQDIVRKRLLADDPTTLERLGADWGVARSGSGKSSRRPRSGCARGSRGQARLPDST